MTDLHADSGWWPQFCAAAAATVAAGGMFRSIHAVPLRQGGQLIGALNLFRHEPGGLPEGDLVVAQALADVATIAILSRQTLRERAVLNEQLQTALDSRVLIEQAKGVIAAQEGLSMEAAFERLRSYSRNHNQRLREVARKVIEHHVDVESAAAG